MTDKIQPLLQAAESGRALLDATDAVLLLLDHQAGAVPDGDGTAYGAARLVQAAVWGALAASGLLIGAVGGFYTPLQHTAISRAMTFAAGAILALVSETMIPEAFHGSPLFNGLLLVVGFVVLLILLVLSH